MDNKITVVARDNKAEILVGNAFHILEDASKSLFKTNTIGDFSEYIKNEGPENDIDIFYSTSILTAYSNYAEQQMRCIEPFVQCGLCFSDQLQAVTGLNGKSFIMDKLEEKLESLKKYCNKDGIDLLRILKDQSIQKIIDIQRKKDNAGNYSYSFSISNGGKKDVEYPTEIKFTIPLYKHHKEEITITFTVIFSFEIEKSDNGPNISMQWKIINYSLEEEIRIRQEEVIETYIKDLPCKKWRGEFSIIKKDDSWKYLPNIAR